MPETALLVVDVQNDFLPEGALPVPQGDEVVQPINELMPRYELVVATQDWHPPDHGSFATQHQGKQPGEVILFNGLEQILWPEHCIQHTPGASFASGLDVHRFDLLIRKGADPAVDSYSGFFDNGHRVDTGLDAALKERGVGRVDVCGLALDVCVLFTVLDARRLGYEARLLRWASRGVELKEGDVASALRDMRQAGAQIDEG